nr:MAG TPA: hypothetical protein [Bacteriophage sp.]
MRFSLRYYTMSYITPFISIISKILKLFNIFNN